MALANILVVDDEPDIRSLLQEILEDEGYEVAVASDAAEAQSLRRVRRPDLILLDIWMPDVDGLSLLKQWSESDDLPSPVVMMSGHGTVETAVEATRLGAYDFIEKPLSLAKILVTVSRALEHARLSSENRGLQRQGQAAAFPVGACAVMAALRASAERIAGHDTNVFITGESGTGKEVLARFIHSQSPRRQARFVNVSVAGLARENPDAELFGSEQQGRVTYGSLELANGGTLFLKDVADMEVNTQARLLSALENRSFLRVGGIDPVSVDVRIIASTSQDLNALVRAGKFRDDLYYNLNVLPLQVPALHERREDIEELLDWFVADLKQTDGLSPRHFSPRVRQRLKDYHWPGNIRELRNFVQRLLILGTQDTVELHEVDSLLGIEVPQYPESSDTPEYNLPLREAREQFEKRYLEHQLTHCNGSVSQVAERAGIERTHLYRKLRSLGLDPKQIKQSRNE